GVGRALRHGRQLLQADTTHERGERLAGLATLLVEAGDAGDRRGRGILPEATEALPHPAAPLAHRAAHQDRVVGSIRPVALRDRVTREADITDVMLAARVRTAAHLDTEATEPRREPVA